MKEKLINALLASATKLQNQKYMSAIKNAFTVVLPVIIVGSFCTLFINVICSVKPGTLSQANIPGMAWLANFAPIFTGLNYATMNLLSIYVVILIAIELAKFYNFKDQMMCAITALAGYISLCATTVAIESNGEIINVANVLSKDFTGVQGLFLAMIVGIVATKLYIGLSKIEKLKIKMPDTVPSNVAAAFNALMPTLFAMTIVSTLGCLFSMITGLTVFEIVNMVIQKPLQGLLTGLPGYLFIFFMSTVLWFFGIHGTQVLKPIYAAALLASLAENADNVTNGLPATNILNDAFRASFTTITGAGVTGGLILAIFIFSKRDDWRAIAKLGLAPAIFNINEPITFGLPIVLNPLMGIPFMLAPNFRHGRPPLVFRLS